MFGFQPFTMSHYRQAVHTLTDLAFLSSLETVGDGEGLVPPLLGSARDSPHAPHWSGPAAPGLNPTAGICGLLAILASRPSDGWLLWLVALLVTR